MERMKGRETGRKRRENKVNERRGGKGEEK